MVKRRGDLYSVSQLTTPSVGEFKNLEDIKAFYARGGALLAPGIPRVPTVSQCYRIYASKKQDVNLVEILKVCYEDRGVTLKWRYQKRGTCVGQGAATAADMVIAIAWLVFGKVCPARVAVAPGYAGSRVEIAGKPGSWDGSNGSWIAEFMTDWGVATLPELGLNEQELDADERLAIQWTASREGVPAKFELIAKERPIIRAPQVKTADELIACLESGNPVIHGSNLIPYDRNTNDVVPIARSGGHLTVFGAIRWRADETCDILYVNSWGEGWGQSGCVWITLADAVRILGQNDAYAFIGIQGLAQEIPLF